MLESVQKHLGITPRAVQLTAAALLERRTIVEMETGEGKSLTVAMAAIAMATRGQRVFIATANDYLAARDAVELRPLYDSFGLRTGAVTSQLPRTARRPIYDGDVVYGTIRELGFDTLRDELAAHDDLHRDHRIVPRIQALVVDEADSVLIDEALTPLVINEVGEPVSESLAALFRWSEVFAKQLISGHDFVGHQPTGSIALTDDGIAKAIHRTTPIELREFSLTELLHSLERAIHVATRVLRDVHYIVKDDRVWLVDENTGRLADAKKMSGGIHQAIEAKEGLPLTATGPTAARMTIQELINRVPHLCGVTATAREDKRELRSVYGLSVSRLAPFTPSRRQRLRPYFFNNSREKQLGIVDETRQVIAAGRAVLIGTRTIDQSESLSGLMRGQGVVHVVLNARQSSEEATIVAQAGGPHRVTIATNMAGRGTDIRIAYEVRRAGGLHVIVSEPHAAARIDRQLAGRCGRQGDPGTVRHYFAADDAVLKLAAQGDSSSKQDVNRRWGQTALLWQIRRAQATIAKRHRAQRYQLAKIEAQLTDDMRELGLDPHLDRVGDV